MNAMQRIVRLAFRDNTCHKKVLLAARNLRAHAHKLCGLAEHVHIVQRSQPRGGSGEDGIH